MRRALALIALFVATSLHAATDVFTVGSVTAPAGTISVPVFVRDVSTTALGADKGAGLRIQGIAFKVTFSPAGSANATFMRAGVLLKTPLFETTLPVTNGLGYVASFAESNNALPFASNAAAPGQLIGYLVVTTNAAAGTVIDISLDPVFTTLSNQTGTVTESFANTTLSSQDGSITVSSGSCPAFSSAAISIEGPAEACDGGTGGTATVAVSGGSSPMYQWGWRWSPGGTTNPIIGATGASYVINGRDFGGSGTRYLVVTATSACAQITSSPAQLTITSTPDVAISASTGVYANSTENFASVPDQGAGATYSWSIANGTITAGQGTRSIRYSAGASGTVGLDVSVNASGCTPHVDVAILQRPAGASMLYLLTPCRIADSRDTTAIVNGEDRAVTVAGVCGVPAGAKAVTANLTIIAPPTDGWMGAFPSDLPWPGTSTINYRANRTRANNAVIPLSGDGRITLKNSGSTLHFIVDVTGYFK